MQAALKQEYEMVHCEVVEVRTCITSYISMFFAVGIGAIGVIAYLISLGVFKDTSQISGVGWKYLPLALAYIVLAFTSILFHKFNTHNRGCGYLRALEQERHGEGPHDKDVVFLWQSVLAAPYQAGAGFGWGRIDRSEQFAALTEKLRSLDAEFAHPFKHIFRTTSRCLNGLGMICRATIFRSRTRSWTFPFQIAFGSLAVTALLFLAWLSLPVADIDILQLGIVTHLMLCWMGLGYRLYRLSADEGDRTIEAWCWRAIVQRRECLDLDGIKARYFGAFPRSIL
jgi:hypothetical protein